MICFNWKEAIWSLTKKKEKEKDNGIITLQQQQQFLLKIEK